MALSESRRQPLVPSHLYSPAARNPGLTSLLQARRLASLSPPSAGSPATPEKSFLIQAPSEPGKIEMYSPTFYAACTFGGILSCGLTHMAVTPLDLVKCNMQVTDSFRFFVRSVDLS